MNITPTAILLIAALCFVTGAALTWLTFDYFYEEINFAIERARRAICKLFGLHS